jgi:hypothetical protein
VSYVRPILATKQLGITVGDAHMADGSVVRFRVLSRDPAMVSLAEPERRLRVPDRSKAAKG